MINQNNNFIFGCWRLNEWQYSADELYRLIKSLIELGINQFDHADIYGDYSCESLFGEVLRQHPELREQILLTTKNGIKLPSSKFPEHTRHIYDTSYQHILAATDRSLKNLATDYVDLLLIHRADPLMNPEEIALAFNALHNSGKVLNFGVSNFSPSQFELLQSYLDFPLQTNQIEVSVLSHEHFDNGNLNYLYQRRIRPQIWSPLSGGQLFMNSQPSTLRVRKVLHELAAKYYQSIEVLAIAWLLAHPAKLQIILGSGKLERVKSLLNSQAVELTREDWFSIWTAYLGRDIL